MDFVAIIINITKVFTKFRVIIFIFPVFHLLTNCTEIIDKNGVTAPRIVNIEPVANTVELPDGTKQQMNGIYSGSSETGFLDKTPILKWNGNLLNIYTGSDDYTVYALKGGIRNDSLIFEGASINGSEHIKMSASIQSAGLINTTFSEGNISFACQLKYSDSKIIDETHITFRKKLVKDLSTYTIIIHDGGSNGYFASNSLGGIKHGGLTGANGMEVDVNISHDGIPFLFHDPEFEPGNINSDFCLGPVTDYKMEDIKLLALLPDGSKVPTLDEALNTILNQTNIKTVWLDIKNANSIAPVVEIIKKYYAKAELLNRTIEIFIGLPGEDAVNEFKTVTVFERASILTELSPDVVQAIDADAWGPQWDTGTNSPEQISYVHSLGKRVFCWTIDDPAFFNLFSENTQPDGIITNNPQKMIYEYLIKNN